MTKEFCGHPTKNGPCNMPKGHAGNFHRARDYPKPAVWSIEDNQGNVIEEGNGRVPLSYAITRCLRQCPELVIRLRN